ncbi:ABR076Cp [Eremothecium gossypii ATCC 10895]|uniref:ABR076Cp n=1 Tax=Eremothecium gossypii (strain ATCC 10895 / CBS 109.51 / FGSC 9923 / NRRL Y-1056) TaxID=284811 RepID=Q75DF0_EREGS|nr:ABR076Cp [Eremothecium gossypii ATCC 10895]AAS50846.2 ABR076Cp [Eremothecium gossypii ATCC 10895]AEY95135.1 FABR076Cp [Eremothecium gossypii FDAG1]
MHSLAVAVVTGGTRGIGYQVVQRTLAEGLSCVFVGSSEASVATAFDQLGCTPLREHQFVRGVALDLATWPAWPAQASFPCWERSAAGSAQRAAALLDLAPGGPRRARYHYDLLVNCAGVSQASLAAHTSADAAARLLHVNLGSLVSLCQLSVRPMLRARRVAHARPTIVNVASVLGCAHAQPPPGTAVYAASKSAVIQYSRALAAELERTGIACHAVAPGLVPDTDMIAALPPDARARLAAAFPEAPTTPRAVCDHIWRLYRQPSPRAPGP